MNENKTPAKNLTAGTWIVTQFGVSIVQHVHDYANGWVVLSLSDGQSLDTLAYAQFTTV